MLQKSILFIVILPLIFSCQKSYQKKISTNTENEIEEFFIHANKMIIEYEENKIDSLIKVSKMVFYNDSTGIRYSIFSSINSNEFLASPKDGDVVSVAYSCFVFDNTNSLFNSSLMDTITFKIGYSKQMRGLNYGIKLLHIGDKAKIIIPSYLGFGMSGYTQSVPPYSTLLLNVKLLNIE